MPTDDAGIPHQSSDSRKDAHRFQMLRSCSGAGLDEASTLESIALGATDPHPIRGYEPTGSHLA